MDGMDVSFLSLDQDHITEALDFGPGSVLSNKGYDFK